MSKPVARVEIKFDNTNWTDVSQYLQAVGTGRGKSRELDRYRSGTAQVVFNNNSRIFDPTNSASPYFGQVIPKKQVRILSNNRVQFVGTITDWNFNFEPNGSNTATIVISDNLSDLANQTINERTNTVQFTGARINEILSLPEVNWPLAARLIDTGQQELGADTIPQGTNALAYLHTVEGSEPGSIFIGKEGDFVFKDRTVAPTSTIPVLSDAGSGIPYTDMQVVFGTELLYNEIVLENRVTGGTAIATQPDSQSLYGILNFTRDDMLQATQPDTQDIADFFANKYGNPEYRFESVTIELNTLPESDQNKLLDLELNDVVQIIFTPGNPPTGDAINQYAEVISIENRISLADHKITLGFATLNNTFLILDDVVFGRLDQNALAW